MMAPLGEAIIRGGKGRRRGPREGEPALWAMADDPATTRNVR